MSAGTWTILGLGNVVWDVIDTIESRGGVVERVVLNVEVDRGLVAGIAEQPEELVALLARLLDECGGEERGTGAAAIPFDSRAPAEQRDTAVGKRVCSAALGHQ